MLIVKTILWGMPPKNSGGWTKFPGGRKVIGLPKQPLLELSPPVI